MTYLEKEIGLLEKKLQRFKEVQKIYPEAEYNISWSKFYLPKHCKLLLVNSYLPFNNEINGLEFVLIHKISFCDSFVKVQELNCNNLNIIDIVKDNIFTIDIANYKLICEDSRIIEEVKQSMLKDIVSYLTNMIKTYDNALNKKSLINLPIEIQEKVLNSLILK